MNYDPKFLQFLLANMQSSNQMIIKTYTYPNPLKDCPDCKLVNSDITPKAVELFHKRKPDYNIENLLVDRLTENVIAYLNTSKGKDTVEVHNGCCSVKGCPTQVY